MLIIGLIVLKVLIALAIPDSDEPVKNRSKLF
jgi:hypothetical protein